MNKPRYWICRPCGSHYHRQKYQRTMRCPRCNDLMDKARTYNTRVKKHGLLVEAREKQKRAMLYKRWSKNRTTFNTRLVLSRETKAAWRALIWSKQKRSFKSKGEEFLAALRDDVWSCPHKRGYESEYGEAIASKRRTCRCKFHGGNLGFPKIKIEDRGYSTLGLYHRSLMKGHRIEIYWDVNPHRPRGVPAGEHRFATLIHETVHWLDSLSGWPAGYGSHTKAFYARVEDLAKLLHYDKHPRFTPA